MTPIEYQQRVLQTAVQLNTQQEYLGLCALGLAGETGEVVELIDTYFHGGEHLAREYMLSELGDVYWYVALLCSVLQVSPDRLMSEPTHIPATREYVISCTFSLSVAVGRIGDSVKKYLYHHNGKPLNREGIYSDLVLVSHYLSLLVAFGSLTLQEVMIANIAKLQSRHSQGFTSRYASDSHASE